VFFIYKLFLVAEQNTMNSTHTTHERFKSHFPDPHSIVVALHAKSISHALEQADIALTNGAD
jgi:hypothetical protein